MKFLAWLRHKLFGTEFVAIKLGKHFFFRKVRYMASGQPYAITYPNVFIRLPKNDKEEEDNYIYWIYKNKGEQ